MNETPSPYDVWAPRKRSSSSRRRWPRDARRLLGVVGASGVYPRPSRRLLSQLQMRSGRSFVTFRRVAVRIWAARKSRTGSRNQLLASNTVQNFSTRNTGVGNADRIYAWLCQSNLY
jgi:hypothetical protein